MARITITDDAGTIIISREDDEIGNPDKPMEFLHLAGEIAQAIRTARSLDETEREQRRLEHELTKDPKFGEKSDN